MNSTIPTYGNPNVTEELWLDRYFGSAFYLFHSLSPHSAKECFKHVIPGGLDKKALVRMSDRFSTHESVVVRIALDLFDNGCVKEHRGEPITVGDLKWLSSKYFDATVHAFSIFRDEASALDLIDTDSTHSR